MGLRHSQEVQLPIASRPSSFPGGDATYTPVYRISSGASGDTAMAEPLAEARDITATCRAAWGTAHSTMSLEPGVDGAALVVYNTATDHGPLMSSRNSGIPSRNDRRSWI
jgi:hypothetical protein